MGLVQLVPPKRVSTGDHADFHRLDIYTLFFQPIDGRFHLVALSVQLEADDADFVGHVGLADVRHDLELVADLPDQRFLDELGREHQPKPLLRGRGGLRRRKFFLGGHIFVNLKFQI